MEHNSIKKPRSFPFLSKILNRTKTVEPPKPTFNDYIPMDDYNNTSFENSKTKINTKVTMCSVTWNMHGLKPTIDNIKTLLDKYNLTTKDIYFHNDFNTRTYCPHKILDYYGNKKNFIEKYSLKQLVDEIEKIVASSKLVSGKDEY